MSIIIQTFVPAIVTLLIGAYYTLQVFEIYLPLEFIDVYLPFALVICGLVLLTESFASKW